MVKPKVFMSFAIVAGSLALSSPALAGERTIEISIEDLNLNRPSAQARLQERVARAVKQVCSTGDSREFLQRHDIKRCMEKAQADADAQITQRIAEHRSFRKQASRNRLKLASD